MDGRPGARAGPGRRPGVRRGQPLPPRPLLHARLRPRDLHPGAARALPAGDPARHGAGDAPLRRARHVRARPARPARSPPRPAPRPPPPSPRPDRRPRGLGAAALPRGAGSASPSRGAAGPRRVPPLPRAPAHLAGVLRADQPRHSLPDRRLRGDPGGAGRAGRGVVAAGPRHDREPRAERRRPRRLRRRERPAPARRRARAGGGGLRRGAHAGGLSRARAGRLRLRQPAVRRLRDRPARRDPSTWPDPITWRPGSRRPTNGLYLAGLLVPVAFLPLLAPGVLLLAVQLPLNMVSSWPYAHEIRYHYVAPVIPFVFLALVRVLEKTRASGGRKVVLAALGAGVLAGQVFFALALAPPAGGPAMVARPRGRRRGAARRSRRSSSASPPTPRSPPTTASCPTSPGGAALHVPARSGPATPDAVLVDLDRAEADDAERAVLARLRGSCREVARTPRRTVLLACPAGGRPEAWRRPAEATRPRRPARTAH